MTYQNYYIMKKQILVLCLLVSTMTILKAQDNLSEGPVETYNNAGVTQLNGEIFRFKPGLVTQLQSGTDFGFGNEWFALGKVSSGQDFYGIRFQLNRRGLTMGYTDATPNKPRIQWIHNGSSTADYLEFRVGNGFSGPGTNTLVASMSPFFGNTYFGTNIDSSNPFSDNNTTSPKVGIDTEGQLGFSVRNFNTSPSTGSNKGVEVEVQHQSGNGVGVSVACLNGLRSTGVFANADAIDLSIGVHGLTPAASNFSAAIYGDAGTYAGNNYAGYFDGIVLSTVGYIPSDSKLKNNINNEISALKQISLLRPITYNYIETEGISLPAGNQHGFISQELAEVFPELTKDITKPIFEENGEIVSDLSYKAVNYTGLISVLTAGIQELNTELTAVGEKLTSVSDELAEYKANDKIRQSLVQDNREVSDYSMEQNIPNPFNDRSIIRYQLAPDVNQAHV